MSAGQTSNTHLRLSSARGTFCLPEMLCFVILVSQKSDFKGAGLDVCTSERRTHTS